MLRYVCVTFFGIWVGLSVAVSEEEITGFREFMSEPMQKCMDKFKISKEGLEDAKEKQDYASIETCFIACTLKEKGIINDEGMFDKEVGFSIAEKFVSNADELKQIKKIGETCAAVNDEEVSDGNQGCERSILMIQCFMENKGGDK